MTKYQLVILCGGMGSRLKEETEFKPKPLVEIGGKPILWHVMKIYSHYDYKSFILCLGYKGNMIKEYFLNFRAMNSDFEIALGENKQLLFYNGQPEDDWRITLADTGLTTMTGGRIKKIEKYIQEDTFLATYGDGVSDIDIDDLVRFHHEKGKIATLTGVCPISRFGGLEVDDDSIAKSFIEKPRLDERINGGFFVFNREIFKYLDDNSILEQEPLSALAEEGQLAVYQHPGFWKCMDTYRDFLELNAIWSGGNAPWKIW